MYKIIFIVLSLFACLQLQAQQGCEIIVKGTFTDTLVICNAIKNVPHTQRYLKYEFDGTKNCCREYSVQKELTGKRLFFSCNHDFTYLEIPSEGEILIELSAQGFNIHGANQAKNEYLYKFCQLAYGAKNGNRSSIHLQIGRTNMLAKFRPLVADELFFHNDLKEINGLEEKCLKQLEKSGITDTDFVKQQKLLIKYLEEDLLLSDYVYSFFLKSELSDDARKALNNIHFTDEDLLKYPRVWILLDNFCKYLKEENIVDYSVTNSLAKCAAKIDNSIVKEVFINHCIFELLARRNSFYLLEIIENCKGMQTTEKGKMTYNSLYNQAKNMVAKLPKKGEKAYPFAYKDKNGKVVKLSDFKGKYVLVDVWATWCGPCKAQIPYIKQLEKEMEGRNIAFVSVCVNKQRDYQKWVDYIETNDMPGHCLFAEKSFQDGMMVKYAIKAIPRFILIDPDGNLISADTQQPRNPAFREYLKNIVK